jgi:hypothetical protein
MIRVSSSKVWLSSTTFLHRLRSDQLLGIGALDHLEESRTPLTEECRRVRVSSDPHIPNAFAGMGWRIQREGKLFRRRPPSANTRDVPYDRGPQHPALIPEATLTYPGGSTRWQRPGHRHRKGRGRERWATGLPIKRPDLYNVASGQSRYPVALALTLTIF